MKNVRLLLLFIACLLVGCVKPEKIDYAKAIYGKWYQTAYMYNSYGSFCGQEDGTYLQFNTNGTFIYFYSGWGSFNETTTGTYTMETEYSIKLLLEDNSSSSISIIELNDDSATFQSFLSPVGTYKYERRE